MRKHISIRKLILTIILVVLCIGGYRTWNIVRANSANKHTQSEEYLKRKNNPWNLAQVDSSVRQLKSGDIVVRRGDDMTSYMLSRLNTTDKNFSHCGVVAVEDGVPYVYHCIGGEDNPDEKMKREKASIWFSPANNLSYAAYRYAVSDSTVGKLLNTVKKFYSDKRMFDMDFSLATDDRMYCSEMVYKAMLSSGTEYVILPTEKFGKKYIGIDDLYKGSNIQPVCHVVFK